MNEELKNSVKIGNGRDEKGRFVEGFHITGRELGSKKEKAFTEYFNEICEEIAKANKMDMEDVKKVIYKVGYAKAKEGNYAFYKDVLDRIHGKAIERVEMQGDVNLKIDI